MPSDEAETIASLRAWDVIWPHDGLAYPPKWKMWVCVSVRNLWFLRINSVQYNPQDAALPQVLHPFLERDSWLGCSGDLIELSEWELEEAMKKQSNPDRQGKVGAVHTTSRPSALIGIALSHNLAPARKDQIAQECDQTFRPR